MRRMLAPLTMSFVALALLTVIGVLIGLNRGDDTDDPGSANSPSPSGSSATGSGSSAQTRSAPG